ncbi:tetratricopeptide repeat protein [Planktothrix agardhii 1801]|uniref:tetratricopeptide repeat protein n=1 Tax=Planktothrix agardhii TaxID=1160 RepID=UPI001F39DACE|nr:tetratricopeptide repeat protein [Planktothrix agardhii]MCF3627082.1 tetratricopeptide repeat protein [Planktothrix agardhii 1801]
MKKNQSSGSSSSRRPSIRKVSAGQPHYDLARTFKEQGEWEKALTAYQTALKLEPHRAEIYQGLGDLFVELGQWHEAVEAYQKALKFNPNLDSVHHNLGDALLKLQRWEDAVAAYQKAIKLNPEFSWSYNNLGDGLRELQRWDEAAQAYGKAIELKPDFALSHHNLGDVLVKKENWERAIAAYQKAVDLDPNFVWSYYNLAEIYVKLDQWDEAVEAYRQVLKIKPDLTEVEEKLNQALHQQVKARLETALSYYRKAIENDPTDVESYQKALEIKPDDAELYFGLGNAWIAKGEVEKAIAAYQQAIAINPSLQEVHERLEKISRNTDRQELEKFESNFQINNHLFKKVNQSSIAGITMVSKNYLPQARVLCETFLAHHPNARFFVLLVDQVDGYFDPEQEQFHLLTIEDIPLPSADTFPYHYTILELNTAVKPFVLKYLFENYDDIDNLVYIDPDIEIFRPIDEVWNALKSHTVVLIPHMRKPFRDYGSPSEVQILQSGTYNLGFIGLKRNKNAFELLDWWMEKLYLDCVVDIPNGLFVDQKWMDLIPGYFPDTYILHDPSYNVAYWNLHDRTVEKIGDEYFVDGRPLAFFHFSGYSPQNKNSLSKHQTRHNLDDLPVVKKLCDCYKNKMLNSGYLEAKDFPYAYGKLSNGIKMGELINFTLRQLIKKHIKFPSPKLEADKFCEFLMTPFIGLSEKNSPPIITSLFKFRPDVTDVFPNAINDFLDEGFINWLDERGAEEHNINELYERFKQHWYDKNIVEQINKILKQRNDVVNAYPNFTCDLQSYDSFCDWLKKSGSVEENLEIEKIEQFKIARGGYYKILNLYFLRPDLQSAFCNIHLPSVREKFLVWLKFNLASLPNIDINECLWFDLVCEFQQKELTIVNLLYNSHRRQLTGSAVNLFEIDKIIKTLELTGNLKDRKEIVEFLASQKAPTPLSQLEAFYRSQELLKYLFPDAFESKENLWELYDYIAEHPNLYNLPSQNKAVIKWINRLEAEIKTYGEDFVVNIAGHFEATTGMGQAARSMEQIVKAAGVNYSKIMVPSTHINENAFFEKENQILLMGWPITGKGANITIVNADSVEHVRKILPDFYWQGRKNIGYWLWETEELPVSQAKSAKGFDEIWTASEYSAVAIRKNVDIPVKVVPCVLDFKELTSITSERSEFNLPIDQILFGFFFDQKSGLERKNPRGLIQAFGKAFGNSQNVGLVLKVNSPLPGNYDYDLLKSEGTGLNIIWIEETYDRAKALRLMNCLDVYVSLHRSEGFGLTLAEAMAMGKPVIATNYSANLDFMDDSNSLLVEAEIITTERSYGVYPKGTRWANPNLDKAGELMKILCKQSLREKYSQVAKNSIKDKLSPDAIGFSVKKLLQKV